MTSLRTCVWNMVWISGSGFTYCMSQSNVGLTTVSQPQTDVGVEHLRGVHVDKMDLTEPPHTKQDVSPTFVWWAETLRPHCNNALVLYFSPRPQAAAENDCDVRPWLGLASHTAAAQNPLLGSNSPRFIFRAWSTNWTPRQRTCLTCETLTSWWARMTSQRSATSTSQLCCTTSKSASSTPSSSTPTAVGDRLLSAFSVKLLQNAHLKKKILNSLL